MSQCSRLAGVALWVAALFAPQIALSHAALIEAGTTTAIRLHAVYDTGTPMAHAQVIIYAPDDPATPWGQGVTDSYGRYEFIPDTTAGRWSVQVRQAGHGTMAHVQISGGDARVVTVAAGPDHWLQRAAMVALVAWGAFGTALFALHRKGRNDASA